MDTMTKRPMGQMTGSPIPGIEKLPPGFQPNSGFQSTPLAGMDAVAKVLGGNTALTPEDKAKQEKMDLVNKMMQASQASLFQGNDPGATFLHRRR